MGSFTQNTYGMSRRAIAPARWWWCRPFSFTSTFILTPFFTPLFSIQAFSFSNQPCLFHLRVLNVHLIAGSGDSQSFSQPARMRTIFSRLNSAFTTTLTMAMRPFVFHLQWDEPVVQLRYRTGIGKLRPGSIRSPLNKFCFCLCCKIWRECSQKWKEATVNLFHDQKKKSSINLTTTYLIK